MNIELTEQQARAVAAAARVGLQAMREPGQVAFAERLNPGDEASAYRAADILEEAVRKSVGGE